MATLIPLGTIGCLYNACSRDNPKLSVILSCSDVADYGRKNFIFLCSTGTIRYMELFHGTVRTYSVA